MKRWEYSAVDCLCGGCGRPVRRGDPRLILQLPLQQPKSGRPMTVETMAAQPSTKVRCATCAGEAVPTDLPPLPANTSTPASPIPKQSVLDRRPLFALADSWRSGPRDGKAAALGKDA